jgi:hypothetical protein
MRKKYKNTRLLNAMLEQAITIDELAIATKLCRQTISRALSCGSVRMANVRKICFVLQRMPVQLGFAPEPEIDLDNLP